MMEISAVICVGIYAIRIFPLVMIQEYISPPDLSLQYPLTKDTYEIYVLIYTPGHILSDDPHAIFFQGEKPIF